MHDSSRVKNVFQKPALDWIVIDYREWRRGHGIFENSNYLSPNDWPNMPQSPKQQFKKAGERPLTHRNLEDAR